eukprot:gene4980-8574_t
MGNVFTNFTSVNRISSTNSFWSIYEAFYEKEPVTIFYHQYKDKKSFESAKNAIHCISLFRHPSILKFKYKFVEENHYCLFASQRVYPLENEIMNLKKDEILFGIQEIINGIEFLNEECNQSFNNLNLNSIYITKDLNFILGDFQFSCSFDSLQSLEKYQNDLKYLLPIEKLKPPEFNDRKRDLLLFPNFLIEINLSNSLKGVSEFKSFKEINSKIQKNNNFIIILNYLKNIKIEKKKEEFFKNLNSKLEKIKNKSQEEKDLILKRVIPKLLQFEILIEKNSEVFYSEFFNFSMNTILNEEEYNKIIIDSFILKSYVYSNHKGLRIILLKYLNDYIWFIKPHLVQSIILEEILKNLNENDEEIYLKSLDSLIILSNYFIKCDEEYNLEIGLNILNDRIIQVLHHSIKNKKKKRRLESILLMFKLWKIHSNLKKEIILSSLKFNLEIDSSNEFKESILNLILLNLSITFNLKELIIDILPLISKLLLHEDDKIRKIANLIFKDSLPLIVNSEDETFKEEELTPLKYLFPGISNVNLIESNIFKDGAIPKLDSSE